MYNLNVIILILGSFAIICQFENTNNFGILVNFATALSFIVAPVVAIFNYAIIKHLDKKYQPPKWLNYLSILGIFYLIILHYFIYFKIIFFDEILFLLLFILNLIYIVMHKIIKFLVVLSNIL